jgi:8-oxo-dGTP diphosphatase
VTEHPRFSVSVAAIIVDADGRVLCIQRRDNGHWEPPGGVLELGERIHDGLIREVKEETGLTVAPTQLTGIYQNQPRDIIALVFRANVTGGEARVGDESSAVNWLSIEDIQARMDPAYAVRVTDATLVSKWPPIRVHDGRILL